MAETWKGISRRLEGSIVVLEPLATRHEEALFEAARDERIWRWMSSYSGESRDAFHAWMELALDEAENGTRVPFATLDAKSGNPVGSTSYLALRPAHLSVEIGHTWLAPTFWRTGANVEAKLLMLEHALEKLGCRRVEFKTDARNERSRNALEALPAKFEGVLRQHMVVRNGDRRDSAYYSVTEGEWPEVKANLLRRLGRSPSP